MFLFLLHNSNVNNLKLINNSQSNQWYLTSISSIIIYTCCLFSIRVAASNGQFVVFTMLKITPKCYNDCHLKNHCLNFFQTGICVYIYYKNNLIRCAWSRQVDSHGSQDQTRHSWKTRILGQIPNMKYLLIIRGSKFLLSNKKVDIPIYSAYRVYLPIHPLNNKAIVVGFFI